MNGNIVLRQLRQRLGLTQTDFAVPAGISPVYVSQVETGAHDLGRDNALKILDVYRDQMVEAGITLEDLLRGSMERAA